MLDKCLWCSPGITVWCLLSFISTICRADILSFPVVFSGFSFRPPTCSLCLQQRCCWMCSALPTITAFKNCLLFCRAGPVLYSENTVSTFTQMKPVCGFIVVLRKNQMSPTTLQLLCVILMPVFCSSINEHKTWCGSVQLCLLPIFSSNKQEFDGKILNLGLHDSDNRSDWAAKLSLCSKM